MEDKTFVDYIKLNVYADLEQNIIVTNEDKLRLLLAKFHKIAERKKEWITPFGFSLTLITVLLTADFKDCLLKANTWENIFIFLLVLSIVWFVVSIKYAFKKNDIDLIIFELKNKNNQNGK